MGSSNPQLKAFINFTHEYNLRKTDKNLLQLQRQIQILSVVSDLSMFQPTSMEALEFFMCLEQLLKENDEKSSLSWKVINLLVHISSSTTIRKAMRDEMQLMPTISQYLVCSKLSKDKCHKILALLQDLSYGIKIVRLEAWLLNFIPFLISSILESEIVHSEIEAAVIILSNLCRGNAPAISLLKEFGERKMLLRSLANLKSPSLMVQLVVSEIMLYANTTYAKLGMEQIMHTLDLLFMVAVDGAVTENQKMLQLSKDVFEEFLKQTDIQEAIEKYPKLESVTQNLCEYITEKCSPECVDLSCQLMALIIPLNRDCVSNQHNLVFNKILSFLSKKEYGVGVHQLFVSLIGVVNCSFVSENIEEIICVLKECLIFRENVLTVATIDWILSVIDVVECICNKDMTLHFQVARVLPPSTFSAILNQLIEGQETDSQRSESKSTFTSLCDSQDKLALKKRCTIAAGSTSMMEKISKAVVNILTVVKQMCCQNPEFKMELRKILGNSRIMKYVVFCERSTNTNYVFKASSILSEESIPGETLTALVEAHAEANIQLHSSPESNELSFPENSYIEHASIGSLTSSLTEETIDKFLGKLNGFVEKSELRDIPLTEVMELYEYKLVGLAHNERNLQKALAAADSQIRETRLELLQSKAESSRLRNLLHAWEGRVQGLQRDKIKLNSEISEIQESARSLRNELVKDKTKVEKKVADFKVDIAHLKQDLEKRTEESVHLERQLSEAVLETKANQKIIKQSKEDIQKLDEKILKLEDEKRKKKKEADGLEEEKDKMQKLNSVLKNKNSELEMLLRSQEETLAEKESQLDELTKENGTLKKIQDMIHNISSGKT